MSTFIKKGKVLNSQYMYDCGNYELVLNEYNNDILNDLINFCNKYTGKNIKLTVEVEE